MKHKICIFDVNETLLDLKALDPHFERIFGNASVRQAWFSQFIHNAFVSIITDNYIQFGKIAMASLEMIANRLDVKLTEDDKSAILSQMINLPAHTDVVDALKNLKDYGFRLYTLTNSTEQVVKTQIENAGLTKFFDGNFSGDTVQALKPARLPYEHVMKELGVKAKDLILIAAHAWDIAGAQNVGYNTAFIARPGMVFSPLLDQPDITGKDLGEVAKEIILKYSS